MRLARLTHANTCARAAGRRAAATRPTHGRSDAEYMALLQEQLAPLYLESCLQLRPVWRAVTAAVRADPTPRVILDLASGPGEPACSLATRFPAAEVVASDSSEEMLIHAQQRVAEGNLSRAVQVHRIDMLQLHQLAAPGADQPPTCDVVTCSLGLHVLPDAALDGCLRGVYTLLRPGGQFVAAVWDTLPIMDIGSRCLSRLLGRSFELPLSPTRLDDSQADALLRTAGFVLDGDKHGASGEVKLTLGEAGTDRAFMLGMMPFMGSIAKLAETQSSVFELARSAFEEETRHLVDSSGQLILPEARFRLLSASKKSREILCH
ncbi:hypothetical protein AB1Y20_006035 [Prymnesium parvum]|uniref:Methyltransferase domain-containing protein n=1 Tax=Prymnesium parvum TaxID=97485 RepID=A0AB34J3J1_PRYPA